MRSLFCLLALAASLCLSSCRFSMDKRVEGNGNLQRRSYAITDFTEVHVAGRMEVYLTQGPEYAVRVEADENLFDYLELEKDGNELEIGTRRGYNLKPKAGVKIYVTAPALEAAELAGSGKIISLSTLSNQNSFRIGVAGSGDVKVAVNAPEVKADVAGSGNLILNGQTRELSVDVAGSGDVKAFDLMTEVTRVDVAGSGNVEVSVSRELDVDVAGSGNVLYKGSPSIKHNKMGSGTLKKVD